jgi:CheY-like chemotaxis protein
VEPAPASATPPPNAESAPDLDRDKLVLIADADVEGGKQIVAAVSGWGLQPVLVHDGVEAMITVQRLLPRAVILDAALPKMYGFQVCEVIKRNQSLRETTVVLVGAIHQPERYRRPPSQLYGADVYLERPDLPEGLAPILRQVGFSLREQTEAEPGPVTGTSAAEPAPVPTPAPAPAAAAPPAPSPTPAAADDGLDDARAKAERLARIIVSDIILYSPEKFEAAAAAGNVVEAMDADLEEGRSLFRQRIDPRIREERDFLVEELQRVAAERGAR